MPVGYFCLILAWLGVVNGLAFLRKFWFCFCFNATAATATAGLAEVVITFSRRNWQAFPLSELCFLPELQHRRGVCGARAEPCASASALAPYIEQQKANNSFRSLARLHNHCFQRQSLLPDIAPHTSSEANSYLPVPGSPRSLETASEPAAGVK